MVLNTFLQEILPKVHWFFFENPFGISILVIAGIVGLTMFLPPLKK